MRALSVYSSPTGQSLGPRHFVCRVREGLREPPFSRDTAGDRVLVRIDSVACRARHAAERAHTDPAFRAGGEYWAPLGADAAGVVLGTGPDVQSLRVGDHVLVASDEPDDHGSDEIQIHREKNLVPLPDCLAADASGLGLSALRGYAVVEGLRVLPGHRVLVASARSSLSLAAMQRLVSLGVSVWAWTTSGGDSAQFESLGVKAVIADPNPAAVKHAAGSLQGFDAVVDPFVDLHFQHLVKCLKPHGRYGACGMARPDTCGTDASGRFGEGTLWCLLNNLEICLRSAPARHMLPVLLEDYSARRFRILTDSVFRGDGVDGLWSRALCSGGRFGKVIYQFASNA